MSTDGPSGTDAPGRGLWVGLALGLPLVAWGVDGAVATGARTHPGELARWVVGAAVVHDLVVLPVVLLVGWALRRLVPEALWPPVRWAVVTSAVLALVAWPFVRGYGVRPTVPSLLDRPYGAGLAVAVAAVWGVAAAWAVLATRGRLAGRRPGPVTSGGAR